MDSEAPSRDDILYKLAGEIYGSHKRSLATKEDRAYASRQEAYRNGIRRAIVIAFGEDTEREVSNLVANMF